MKTDPCVDGGIAPVVYPDHAVLLMHGGLVLYNNGFAAGLVAAILVPVIIALQRPTRGEAEQP